MGVLENLKWLFHFGTQVGPSVPTTIPSREKVGECGGRSRAEREEEAVVLQNAESGFGASTAESKPAWPDHAAAEPVHAASADLFRSTAALTFCATGRHSWSGAVLLPQEAFCCTSCRCSTCPFFRAVSCSAPLSLWSPSGCHLPALKSVFPALLHSLFKHSGLPCPVFSVKGIQRLVPMVRKLLGKWLISQNVGLLSSLQVCRDTWG